MNRWQYVAGSTQEISARSWAKDLRKVSPCFRALYSCLLGGRPRNGRRWDGWQTKKKKRKKDSIKIRAGEGERPEKTSISVFPGVVLRLDRSVWVRGIYGDGMAERNATRPQRASKHSGWRRGREERQNTQVILENKRRNFFMKIVALVSGSRNKLI